MALAPDLRKSVLTADERTFLVYRNYEAILGYNCSHYYALSVAMLADRWGWRGAFQFAAAIPIAILFLFAFVAPAESSARE